MTKLGSILKVLPTKFLSKLAHIIVASGGYIENVTLQVKTSVPCFWETLEKIRLLFIPKIKNRKIRMKHLLSY